MHFFVDTMRGESLTDFSNALTVFSNTLTDFYVGGGRSHKKSVRLTAFSVRLTAFFLLD
jgi:hypothetical protein